MTSITATNDKTFGAPLHTLSHILEQKKWKDIFSLQILQPASLVIDR